MRPTAPAGDEGLLAGRRHEGHARLHARGPRRLGAADRRRQRDPRAAGPALRGARRARAAARGDVPGRLRAPPPGRGLPDAVPPIRQGRARRRGGPVRDRRRRRARDARGGLRDVRDDAAARGDGRALRERFGAALAALRRRRW